MEVNDISKNTRKKIWEVMVNMPNTDPLAKMVYSAKTEQEILEKLPEFK